MEVLALADDLTGALEVGAKFAARVPPGFSTNSNIAGLRFDASHVHVYADSRLVEGAV